MKRLRLEVVPFGAQVADRARKRRLTMHRADDETLKRVLDEHDLDAIIARINRRLGSRRRLI